MYTTVALYLTLAGAIFIFFLLIIAIKALVKKNKEIADLKFKVKDLESKVFELGGR